MSTLNIICISTIYFICIKGGSVSHHNIYIYIYIYILNYLRTRASRECPGDTMAANGPKNVQSMCKESSTDASASVSGGSTLSGVGVKIRGSG